MKSKRGPAVVLEPRKELAPSGLVALGIAGLTLMTYAWIVRHGAFLSYDDLWNLVDNPNLRGMDGATLRWALFSSGALGNYEPVYWLVAAAEREVFGAAPRGPHLVGVLLHAADAALVYALGVRLIGLVSGDESRRRRAWVHLSAGAGAFLFALHPLRVECVAWLSGRHYCLATMFALLSTDRYLHWAAAPGSRRRGDYLWSLAFFGLSLFSLPIAGALPIGFLLLDIFPLRRSLDAALYREKIPFLGISFLAVLATLQARSAGGSLAPLDAFPVVDRLTLFLYSFLFYPFKTIWPAGLAPVYYVRAGLATYGWIAAGTALVLGALWAARRSGDRSFASALGWHIVLLLPVSGLLRSGLSVVADRYSYLPSASWALFAGGWLFSGFTRMDRHPKARLAAAAGIAMLIGGMIVGTDRQTRFWGDTDSLWRRELAVFPYSAFALQRLGFNLARVGRISEAEAMERRALAVNPDMADALHDLGRMAMDANRLDDAVAFLREALLRHRSSVYYTDLGTALARKGDIPGAIRQYRAAIALDGRSAEAHLDLGQALEVSGRTAEAVEQYAESARLDPRGIPVRQKLGRLLMQRRDLPAAEGWYRELLFLAPTSAQVQNDMGVVLAMQGRIAEAIPHLRQAVQLDPGNAGFRANLLRAAGPPHQGSKTINPK